ncbi:MAG: hypothetical protein ABIG61_02025 [Planctomycetota bacterium]
MAIVNIGKTWHLRYLESYIALFLERKELSSPEKVRNSQNIKNAIEHAEGAINHPKLLTPQEKAVIKDFLLELKSTYETCLTKVGNCKYLCEIIGDSNWEDELIVLKSRIEGTFLPKIQEMASSRTSEVQTDNAGETPVSLREFISNYCEHVPKNLLESRVKSLQSLAQRKHITLKHAGKWKSGQSKKYQPNYLISNWETFRKTLISLPKLKQS